jgi:NADPH:quinone reductase-like Zn-dependent oxidoreductase
MRAYVARSLTGIDALRIEDQPTPAPLCAGQIRVAMRAASVNYRDLLVLSGKLGPVTDALIPCSDGAGEVIDVAPDVWRVKLGDRVALTFNPDWIAGEWRPTPGASGRGAALPGVMRDEMVVGQHEAVVLPDHLSFEEGATLPCAAVTAWHALCGAAPLLPGMSVLVQGGGGVSVFALQFAKLFGARVIAISSSADRCNRLRELGADEAIDYSRDAEWQTEVRALTGGAGVDLAVDIGGAQTVEKSLQSTRTGGRVVLVGLLTGRPQPSGVFAARAEISPAMVGSRADLEAIVRAISFHRARPVIDQVFGFEELPDALRAQSGGKQFGKIAVNFAR